MQWHLDAMQADEMWKVSTGRGVTVAVIDSGVDPSLVDLKGQVLDGKDFSSLRGNEHTDIEGHGTAVSAIIAGTGGRGSLNGSYGLAPDAKILPIRMRYATEEYGQVDNKAEYSRVLSRAIRYAADSPAQIINVSMGSSDAPGRRNVGTPQLAAAVKYALAKGKLIFAAVGNSGDTSNIIEYPAGTPGVVGVGAADENAKALASSQHGPEVDLVAPGSDIVHACTTGTRICKGSGTSFAAALASASAALIWAKHPHWTNNQVLNVMLNTASKAESGENRTDFVGYGVVRPRIALKDPGDPGPADEYPLPDLAAAASKSPSPPKASKPEGRQPSDTPAAAAAAKPEAGGGTGLWIGLGIGAAALLAIGAAVPITRNRRMTGIQKPPSAPPAHQPVARPITRQPPGQTSYTDQQLGNSSGPGHPG